MPVQEEINFKDLLIDLPEFLSAKDLVRLGFYPSQVSIYKSQGRGEAPPSIRVSKNKIRFPKRSLVQWLTEQNNLFSISV